MDRNMRTWNMRNGGESWGIGWPWLCFVGMFAAASGWRFGRLVGLLQGSRMAVADVRGRGWLTSSGAWGCDGFASEAAVGACDARVAGCSFLSHCLPRVPGNWGLLVGPGARTRNGRRLVVESCFAIPLTSP